MGSDIRVYLLAAPAILFSLTVHEFFHAWMANRFGDSTAKDMGRLTLNPLAHLDLFGTLMLFITDFRFGWAKPVPVNPYNLRNYRHDEFWISAAGPLSNLGMALISGTVFRMVIRMETPASMEPLMYMLFYLIVCNVSLAIFNLLPIFPLDGSHIFRHLFPERYGPTFDQIERYSPIILMVLIASGFLFKFSILGILLGPFIKVIVYIVSGIGM